MFYRGLAVVNAFSQNPNNEYKIHRLQEEFQKYSISLIGKDALSLLPLCQGDMLSFRSSLEYDFVVYLDKDRYLAKALSLSFPLFNSYESLVLSDDKMLSILQLNGKGIRVPLTIPAPLCYIDEKKEENENSFFQALEEKLGYPMVFKENHGSLGKQVRLIPDRKELVKTYRQYKKIPHLYEQFLSKHQGHDYRFIVIDKRVVAVMERINESDFRSNIALGGKGFDATGNVPAAYEEIAINSASALQLDYAGIDIAMDENENPVFLEANGNAFFTEIEKVTGINIAEKIASMIYHKVYE